MKINNDINNDIYKIYKNIINENYKPDLMSYIQNLNEIIESIQPFSLKQKRKLDIAKTHLKEIKRQSNKLLEQVRILEEEKIKMLEEKSNKEEK